jgi:hypothetical protein
LIGLLKQSSQSRNQENQGSDKVFESVEIDKKSKKAFPVLGGAFFIWGDFKEFSMCNVQCAMRNRE